MYGILLLSHGDLAKEFLNTSRMILGDQEEVLALGLQPDESRESFEKKIIEACSKLYKKDGLLILTDLYGGTPTNAAIFSTLQRYEKLQILTGLNFSMLLEAIINRNTDVDAILERLKLAGIQGICNIKEAIKQAI